MKPTALVAATSCWSPTARLAIALTNAGFTVKAICSPNHPLRNTGALTEIYTYRGLAPILSFTNAITAAEPDIIIPGDDLATEHLHEVYRRKMGGDKAARHTCALIERSLGSPESFRVTRSRATFLNLAAEEGVRVPKTGIVPNFYSLTFWLNSIGLPAVLKADGTSGGEGVRIVSTYEEAERAFRLLARPPLVARAVKRALVDLDETLVWPSLLRVHPTVSIQGFVPGQEATSLVACWKGRVLAALHFEVLNKAYSTGPATVLRLIENLEMSNATEKMIRRLNLSGLYGFDFMWDKQTGDTYLLEINPRTTQVGHLALGTGRDVPAAIYAAVSGKPVQVRPTITQNAIIALFPNEWMRDADSPFLRFGYHDVPWDAPELIKACVRKRRQQKAGNSSKEGSSFALLSPVDAIRSKG